jgi:hypothetical protein
LGGTRLRDSKQKQLNGPAAQRFLLYFHCSAFGTNLFLVLFFSHANTVRAGALPEAWVCLMLADIGVSLTGTRDVRAGCCPWSTTGPVQGGADGQATRDRSEEQNRK